MRIALFLLTLGLAYPAAAQCTKDTDCKGDRVCVDGKCQDPAPPAPAPTPPPATPAPKKAEAPAPTKSPLLALAKELAEKINMPADRQSKVLARLEKALTKDRVQKEHENDRLICVVAYQMGEGGFIVKKTKGKGLIECLDATDPRGFTIKSTTFGAMIGGSSEWGVGLVFGLQKVEDFGGDYKGSSVGATAGDASTNVTTLKVAGDVAPERYHELYWIGAAAGLSANAGGARLTLQLD